MKTTSKPIFNLRQILVYTGVFLAITIALQRFLRYLRDHYFVFDYTYYWPISVFRLRLPSPEDLVVTAVVAGAFFLLMRLLQTKRFDVRLSCVAGVLLITGLTFVHGLDVGFYAPVAGDARTGTLIPYTLDGQEYYHDAVKIEDPVDFFRRYNEIQPTLHQHAHTHPPGAVLVFYILAKVLRDPALIGVFLMLVSTITTFFFVYRLMLSEFADLTARYMAFLLLLMPAVQIYYLATLDSLIVSLLIGTLYLFCFGEGKKAIAGAIGMLSASFLLTFVSLFILPVLVGFDLLVRRSLKRAFITIGGVGVFYVLLYLICGYDAFQSFRTASLHENPKGFMLFVDPVNYLFTRFEDVAEIILFFGPFLSILFIRGFRDIKFRPLDVLTVLGCVTLFAMFLAGAWRTGETARACAFIYPFLLFPVARYLESSNVDEAGRFRLATLVFLQSLGMQLFGDYHW
jgi:hypothetical protein